MAVKALKLVLELLDDAEDRRVVAELNGRPTNEQPMSCQAFLERKGENREVVE